MRYDLDNHYDISPEINNRHHWIFFRTIYVARAKTLE
jgi:hypothetical protein